MDTATSPLRAARTATVVDLPLAEADWSFADDDAEAQRRWFDHLVCGDADARRWLIERYYPMTANLVYSYLWVRRTPEITADSDDVVGYATEGLISAVDGFDPRFERSFRMYAKRRMRGAVVDGLREADVLSRTMRDRKRALRRAHGEALEQWGRQPTFPELVDKLGVPEGMVWEAQRVDVASSLASLDDTSLVGSSPSTAFDDGLSLMDMVVDEGPLVDERVVDDAEREEVAVAVGVLGLQDRTVLERHILEGAPLWQVGEELGVTESRVCQIKSRALRRLKDRFGELDRLYDAA